MPFSPLDALMQVATPARSLEPPSRNDGPSSFAPALEQAYQAEAPRPAEPAPKSPQPKIEESSAKGKKEDSERSTDDPAAASEGAETAAAAENEQDAAHDADDQDAVEISAEGAAAAGVVQDVKAVEEITVVQAKEGETPADAVKEADAEGSADAAKKQADAAAAAAALQEGEGEATSSESDAASDQSKEPAVSTLHSTRDHDQGKDHEADDHAGRVAGNSEVKIGNEPSDATVELQPTNENGEAKPVVDETPATPTDSESKSKSREPSRAEQADVKAEANQSGQKLEATPATDAVAEAASRVDAAASDAAPSQVTAADSVSPTTETSPKTSAAIDRLLSGHAQKSSRETNESNGMPTVDRARFVQRVEGAMKAAHQGDGKIQVRLSPPDLGSVKIEIAVQNGVLSAKLEAETPAARNLLLDSLPALRERLAQQEIRIEKFDVDVRDQGGNAGSGQADDRTADQSGERQQGRPRPTANRAASVITVPSPRGLAGSSSAAAGLDVRV